VLGGLALTAWLYLHWTDPVVVRQQVIAQLEAHFPGATVHVDTARLRLLGGVSLTDLRLVRRDNPELGDVLYVPEAIIYPDKEQFLQGTFAIRKIELSRPRLHVIRGQDGRWNTSDIIGPTNPEEPLPTIVMEQGTILVEDCLRAPDQTLVEIKGVSVTMLNDPLPTLDISARGNSDLLGPLQAHAVWQRASEAITVSFDTRETPFGPALVQRLAAYCSDLGEHLRQLQGVSRLHAVFSRLPGSDQPWGHHVHWQLSQGKLSHPQSSAVAA
jgi:hypothetical protein